MAIESEPRTAPQLEVLQGVSHAFGSASDFGEVAASASRWVRTAVGSDDAAVRVVLPDEGGRLQVASTDRDVGGGGRRRSARRRAAFHAMTPIRLDLDGESGDSLAILPLVCQGEAVGVLEVVAPGDSLDECWETLLAVASQVALALWHLARHAQLRREVETLGEAVSLGGELMRAKSAEAAVREAVRFLFERFQVPVAAWLPGDDPEQMVLVKVRGLGSRKSKELRAALGIVPRWKTLSASRRTVLTSRFASILGVEAVGMAGSGDALLLAGTSTPSLRASLDFVESLLEGILPHLTIAALAKRRNEELDLGIAWTAHEFRGPLMGVKAALEFLMREEPGSPATQAMLRRSVRELEDLSELVDGLLRWAIGEGSLYRRPVDLVRLVEEAVESCTLETGEDRVSISAPQRAIARVDQRHLRGAIANLVRNALTYSPPGRQVEVEVEANDRNVMLSVRDFGPGIPVSERDTIFEPLMRGGSPRATRTGKGLGLFITRRIVEAHAGKIWFESNGSGTVFHVQLHVDGGRRQPSAS